MKHLANQEKSYIATTQKRIMKNVYEKQLIIDGDKVVVGLSGGKDSLILLDSLVNRKRAMKINYELLAVHIDIKNVPYRVDLAFMQEFCTQHSVPLTTIEIDIDLRKDKKMSTCFICSWHRRTALFKFVNKNSCSKLAFGHHLNDSVETLLLNMSFNAEISSLPYKVEMFDGKFQIIRPMLSIEEDILKRYAKIKGYNREVQECPYANKSKRELIRSQISQLTAINKDAAKNIYRSMQKIVNKYLPY